MRLKVLLIATAFLLAGVLLALLMFERQLPALLGGARQITTGKALIGGPFSLLDHKGRRVTEKDFRGRYMLVYFGFTYCPDVCPAGLQVISEALRMLGEEKAQKVVPIFITVDPERDTVEQMASYVKNFHPRLVGLTGSAKEIAAAASAFRVYYAKVAAEGGANGASDDYTMDHTAITYLMGPDGAFIAHFSHGTSAPDMARRLGQLIR